MDVMAGPPIRDPYQIRLSDVMESPVVLPESASASEVLTSLGRSPAGVVLVTAAGGHTLTGIITRGDLVKFEKGKGVETLKAADIANRSLTGILPTGTVGQALRILDGENQTKSVLSILPVVNANKQIQGIVTRASLNKLLGSWNASQDRGELSY
jgi:CBS domain-containing protein